MKISNTEISKCGLCSEGAVRKAVERGRLNTEDLGSVMGFVLSSRFKQLGVCACDVMAHPKRMDMKNGSTITFAGKTEESELGGDLHYTPDNSQREENRTGPVE